MKTTQQLTLISHRLCPYVQRAVAALEENGLAYKRVDIDLNNKPDWFNKLSPLGRVPLLVVDGEVVLFESAVISEYINDISGGKLLPNDPLARANHRSWIEFASATLNNIGQLYNAVDEQAFAQIIQSFDVKFSLLEEVLPEPLADAGYFNGGNFSLVDAAFAPVFRYFNAFEQWTSYRFLTRHPKITAWRNNLFERTAIKKAAREDYPQLLTEFVAKRPSYLGGFATQYLNNVAPS